MISIVVPTYFRDPHAPGIGPGLEHFFSQFARQREDRFELFISDSGPAQAEGPVAQIVEACLEREPWLGPKVRYHYEVTQGPPLSRADAMNLGVRQTEGEMLLFLHVDCRLPDGGLAELHRALERGVQGGGFLKKYVDRERLSPLLLTEQYLNWLRTWLGRHLVGTNGIFLLRERALEHPYRDVFLEDVELSDWMRQRLQGPQWKLLLAPMEVSARKYRKRGVWPSLAINAAVMAFYRLYGTSPQTLKQQLYHRDFSGGLGFWWEWTETVVGLYWHRDER